jgi:hypothetical protein
MRSAQLYKEMLGVESTSHTWQKEMVLARLLQRVEGLCFGRWARCFPWEGFGKVASRAFVEASEIRDVWGLRIGYLENQR